MKYAALAFAALALVGCQTNPNTQALGAAMVYAADYYQTPAAPAPAYRAPGPCFTRAAPTLYGAPQLQTVCW